MNEKDLRVIKTRESIENAFFELLRNKAVDKITVTELSNLARINKGTFYLHYQDIPDLYRKTIMKTMLKPIDKADYFPIIFEDPERFMSEFYKAMSQEFPRIKALLQDKNELLFMDQLISRLCDKVYETENISRSSENDMKLEAVFSTMLIFASRYDRDHIKETYPVVASLIRFFFPE